MMRKKILYTLLVLALLHTSVFAQNVWSSKMPVPVAGLWGAVSFSIGSKGYIVAGDDGQTAVTKLWEYDPVQDTWTMKANFPGTMRVHAVAFSIDNKGYIGTGADNLTGTILQDFWEWDQATNTWTQKADFAGVPRKFAVGFSADGKGYIGTGWDNATNLRHDFWQYDPATNSWTAIADYPLTCYAGAAFAIGNKGYVLPGHDGVVGGVFPNSFYEYDPSANTWAAKASLPSSGILTGSGRTMAFAFATGSKGFIGTGTYVNMSQTGPMPVYCQDFWEWDQPTDTWTQKADFPGGNRQWTIGFGIGNKGFCGTGERGLNYYNDIWEWSATDTGTVDTTSSTYVGELGTAFETSIYPNPAKESFTINTNNSKAEHIQVFNAIGALVYDIETASDKEVIDIRNWSNGVYLIKRSGREGMVIQKLVKQ